MKLLTNSYPTPEENLAFEEYYFHHFEEPTLRIWKNPRSVIVGKHQNALAESNTTYCMEHNIPVLRRISGGGTVYHDVGNFNFSFFRKSDNGHQIDYEQNLDIISKMLEMLGYRIERNDRHDLTCNGFKISGNAQHMSKGRALHHGTILYDSNKSVLNKAIKREHGIFSDKSVKSVRSVVANLRSVIDLGKSHEFEALLIHTAKETVGDPVDFEANLVGYLQKYFTEKWNFGYGPKYQYENVSDALRLSLKVDRSGCIEEAIISPNAMQEILNSIIGLPHAPNAMLQWVESLSLKQPAKSQLQKLLL